MGSIGVATSLNYAMRLTRILKSGKLALVFGNPPVAVHSLKMSMAGMMSNLVAQFSDLKVG